MGLGEARRESPSYFPEVPEIKRALNVCYDLHNKGVIKNKEQSSGLEHLDLPPRIQTSKMSHVNTNGDCFQDSVAALGLSLIHI